MEISPEKEPLLSKEDKDAYLKIETIEDIENYQKSKEQIVNCQDCLELICFCCYNYDVSRKEYESHLELSNRCSTSYDKENPIHEKLLFEFFENIQELTSEENDESNKNSIKSKKSEDINSIIKKFSKKIGFQNDNPREDLNKSSFFSLEFMNYFINNYKVEAKNMLKEKDFFFTLVCINLIYRINLILYLIDKDKSDSDIYNIYKIERCSRKEIKNFCQHLESDNEKDLMFFIISLCLSYVFEKFKNANSSNINIIIDGALQHFKVVLNEVKKNEKLIDKLKNELKILKNESNGKKMKIN